jgi:MFS family permease
VLTTMTTSIISSLGAQLIPTIANEFHDTLSSAQWSLTVALLSGTISAPVLGRLGDGPHRRATMIGGVASVTLGCVVAAVAPGLLLLLIGRAMQGVGLGLVPLAMATARAELPRDRVAPMIALLSVSAAAGVGVGYPISGLMADWLGLSGPFWFGAVFCGAALACVSIVIPRPGHTSQPARLDWIGAILLAVALSCILIAVAQGATWGWGSTTVLRLLTGGVLAFSIWVLQQLHVKEPLVDLRLLRHSAVLVGDLCAIVLGVAMYMALSSVTEFVQVPESGGFGFSASVVVAGLTLVPLSVFMLAGSRVLPTLSRRLSVRALLAIGCLIVALGCSFFAKFHDSLWESFATMGLIGAGLGTTYAAIPGLIVQAVPQSETGSAMGFYQVARYVGFSFGSALTASILAGHNSALTGQPDLDGYTVTLWVAAGICVIAALSAWVIPARSRETVSAINLDADDVRLLEETEGTGFLADGV